jgi:hypothetical protein
LIYQQEIKHRSFLPLNRMPAGKFFADPFFLLVLACQDQGNWVTFAPKSQD